jgi:hypothetical protein
MRECQVHYLTFERMCQNPVLAIPFGPSITVPITLLLGTRGGLSYSATL